MAQTGPFLEAYTQTEALVDYAAGFADGYTAQLEDQVRHGGFRLDPQQPFDDLGIKGRGAASRLGLLQRERDDLPDQGL